MKTNSLRDIALSIFRQERVSKKDLATYRDFMTVTLDNGEKIEFEDYTERLYWLIFSMGRKPSYHSVAFANEFFIKTGMLDSCDVNVNFKSSYKDFCSNEQHQYRFYLNYKCMSKAYASFSRAVAEGKIDVQNIVDPDKMIVEHSNALSRRYPEQYDHRIGKVISIRGIHAPFNHIYMYAHTFYRYIDLLALVGIRSFNDTQYSHDVKHYLYTTSRDKFAGKDECHCYHLTNEYLHNYYGFFDAIREWASSYKFSQTMLKNVLLSMDSEECSKYGTEVHRLINIAINFIVEYIKHATFDSRQESTLEHLNYVFEALSITSSIRSTKIEELEWQQELHRIALNDPRRSWSMSEVRRFVWTGLEPKDVVHMYFQNGDYFGWRKKNDDDKYLTQVIDTHMIFGR